ncbi:MAG: ABC transporter substrate-binding protein [Actinomycetota bacterium]
MLAGSNDSVESPQTTTGPIDPTWSPGLDPSASPGDLPRTPDGRINRTRTSVGTENSPIAPGPHPGVTDTTITVCYLVPLTGASPVPTDWEKGVNVYWEHLASKGGIHGRNVQLLVKDTESDPATAKARARDCINEQAFVYLIMDRTYVEATVVKFLNDENLPHVLIVPLGAKELKKGGRWTNTFGAVMGVEEQGRLIADYFTTGDLKGKRPAVVRDDAPDTVPGTEAMRARLKEKGVALVAEERIDPNGNDYSSTVLNLKRANAEVVWVYAAPVTIIKIAQQAQAAAYLPIWFACAPSWNFNQVLQIGNSDGAMKNARAFSPWSSLSSPAVDEFKAVYRARYNQEPDDIGVVGWGFGEVLTAALQAAGRDLGHDTLRAAFQNLHATPKIWAPLDFGPGVRIGSNVIMEFREAGDHWEQVGTFRNTF